VDERISCIAIAESGPDGTICVTLRVVDGANGFSVARTILAVAFVHVDRTTARLNVLNPKTGTVAHFQAGSSIFSFIEELGLQFT